MQDESRWRENNAWWKSAVQRMGGGTATARDWDEANRRLWCLSKFVPEGRNLQAEDRHDLVQTVFLRLTEPQLLARLKEVDTPAHYLCRLIRNHLRNEWTRERAASRVMRRHAEMVQRCEDERPDEQVAWQELCTKARFSVLHSVSREDREILLWYYWEELTAAEIGKRLKINEGAALQRLFRAKKRLKKELDK